MLKQILATTTVLAIAVVSIQSASAASGKFRQLVVEPAGASADPILKKKKKFQQLVVAARPGHSDRRMPTPARPAASRCSSSSRPAAASRPRPTAAAKATARASVAQLVVASGDGIPTPGSGGGAGNGGGNGNGKSGGKNSCRVILKPSNGIEVASADPGKPPKTKVLPAIVDLSGISKPVGDDSTGPGADATPPLDPALEPQPTDATEPAADGVDNGGAGVPEASPAAKPAIQSPQDLYSVLLTHGYGVEILKHDAHGNLVFYVTSPGNPKEADLLLVDAEYGKVKERKHILAYGYERPQAYAPRYASAYASEDNCDQSAAY